MDDKQAVRERIWRLLEQRRVARFPGARGRIPNFAGAGQAAVMLASVEEWKGAKVLKSNPDAPQLPVRAQALAEGKRVYMAVPRLVDPKPFLLLDPKRLKVRPRQAASIKGAGRHGVPVAVSRMGRIDLVVCGTVAVNRSGVRVGKGGGFSDIELALLIEAGRVDDRTVIATTVHPLQVLDEDLPETEHDFRVDIIVTAEEVIRPGARKRPPGIVWSDLDQAKIDQIPALAVLARWRN
jgi:5-formyltetrahydrofolate cyclo-ligase